MGVLILQILFQLQRFAHEIGHNLGLRHDFDFQKNGPGTKYNVPRSDSKGKKCTKINSIMDYPTDGVRNKWSTCSPEDFEEFYNLKMNEIKKFCLDTL